MKQQSKSDQGFALIATILVMSMLMLLSVSMLTMSSVSTRNSVVTSHQQVAQANARMALMLALGDIQKYAGADRRVTAPASILSDTVNVHKRNWTTVWDTSDWDVTDPVSSRDDSAYLATLVSRRLNDSATTRAQVVSDLASAVPASDPDWIQLVSDGSVEEEDDYVYAEAVNVETIGSKGTYAYWVGDEGVKARFDIEKNDNHSTETWAKAGRMGSPRGTGVHTMTGMDAYKDYLPGGSLEDDLAKFIDYRTMDLSAIEKSTLKRYFHDVTNTHTGLLVDNRWGGIRRDLSTAFELDIEEFGEIEEFNASGEQNKTDEYSSFTPNDVTTNPLYYSEDTDDALGYLYEVPVDSSKRYRGPTWDILRNHYRIYKKERNDLNFRGVVASSNSDAIVAHGVVPFSYNSDPSNPSVNNSIGSWVAGPHVSGGGAYAIPMVSSHGVGGGYDGKGGGRTQPTVQKITPQLIRAIFVYGMAKEGSEYFLTIDPYFVLHNPYNKALEFHSLAVDLNGMVRVVEFEMKYEEEGTGNQKSETFNVQDGSALKSLQSFRLEAPPTGNYRLEAGEIKVMSVREGYNELGGDNKVIQLSELQYNESSGVYLGEDGHNLNVAANSTITVEASLRNEQNITSIFTRLLHPIAAAGGQFKLDDVNTFNGLANFNRNHDYEKMSLIQQMRVISLENKTLNEKRAANVNQIPSPSNGSFYMYALDIGLKDFSGDVAVMSDFNYRSLGFGPRDYDGGDSVAPNWDLELKPSDLFDLQFVDANSSGYWGEGKTPASGGSSRIVLFDLPRTPLSSLAALQHADTSMLNFHAMHSIANSRMQVGQTDQKKIFNQLRQVRTSTTPRYQIDTSWASNEALWDRYYFSGINWGTQLSSQPFITQDAAVQNLVFGSDPLSGLVNPRMTLMGELAISDIDELKDYQKIGKHLGISGAFNVNSTSVEAWKAVLSSLSGREISYLSGTNLVDEKIDESESPMSRFTTPAGGDDDDYSGYRSLTGAELNSLAEEIVEQVKLRGPFMGLSDFVNRRLVDDETGKAGAIQAAIDESKINDSLNMGNTSGNRLEQSAPVANQGMSRHLNQGDVLTPLAPIMATRSDTFVIRAYGDSKDASGKIISRAWCEATVQRTPEWLESTTESGTVKSSSYPTGNSTAEPILRQWEVNPNLPESSKNFGRKVIIKAFRWLSEDEV